MKNKLKRVTIATLSACMIANAVPIPGNVAKAAVTQEMIDFTDENSQGGWVKMGQMERSLSKMVRVMMDLWYLSLQESPFSNMEIPKPVRMEFLKWILP